MKKYLLILLLVFVSCDAQQNNVSGDWPTFRANNQRTGYTNVEPLEKKPEIKWRKKIGTKTPLVAKGVAYINSEVEEKSFYAYDLQQERELWRTTIDFPIHHSVLDHKGTVYLVGFSQIIAIDEKTGSKIWETITDPQLISGMAVENDLLYVSGNRLTAYDVKTGNQVWEYDSQTAQTKDAFFEPPSLHDGVLYLNMSIKNQVFKLLALDSKTGKEKWHSDTFYTSYPVIEGTSVLVGGKGHLAAFTTDAEKAEPSNLGAVNSIVGSAKETAYLTRENAQKKTKEVYALDLKTSQEKWVKEIHGDTKTTLITPAVITDDLLYYGVNKVQVETLGMSSIIYALDVHTGKEVWNMEIEHHAVGELIALDYGILLKTEYMPGLQNMDSEDYLAHFLFMLQ